MPEEAGKPITADELVSVEEGTTDDSEEIAEAELSEEKKAPRAKKKKPAKHKTTGRKSARAKKHSENDIVPEPEGSLEKDETVVEAVFPDNPTPKTEPEPEIRPDINASIESIYGSGAEDLADMDKLDIKKTSRLAKFFGWLISAGAVICAAGLLAWWYLAPNLKSLGDNVDLQLKSSENVVLGTTTTLTIAYTNNESVAIRNTVLQAYYPSGFVVSETSIPATNPGQSEWLLGTIPPKDSRVITVTGKIYAPLNIEGTFRSLLSYRPDGFESTFQKNVHIPIIVSQSPVKLSLIIPQQSLVGVIQNYQINVNRPIEFSKTNLSVKLTVPEFLTISSSSIPFNNKVFILSDKVFSTSTNSATISFNGIWNDAGDMADGVVRADLLYKPTEDTVAFSIANDIATTTLIKNEASLSLAINGSTKLDTVQPGDVLATTIQILNNGKTTLKNGTLKLVYEGPAIGKTGVFNWASLTDSKNGTVTGEAMSAGMRRGTIVWTVKQIPSLASIKPGETVLVDVTLPIKDAQSFEWGTVTGTGKFKVVGNADFVDENKKIVHVESSEISMKLRTDVAVEVRDNLSGENNLTHQITWLITNNLHPLKNIALTATLYGDLNFVPPTTTPAGTLVYDKKTQILTWTIPEMPDGLDVLAMPFVVTINKSNPTQTSLQSKVRFKATDTVTNDVVELLGDEITLTP